MDFFFPENLRKPCLRGEGALMHRQLPVFKGYRKINPFFLLTGLKGVLGWSN